MGKRPVFCLEKGWLTPLMLGIAIGLGLTKLKYPYTTISKLVESYHCRRWRLELASGAPTFSWRLSGYKVKKSDLRFHKCRSCILIICALQACAGCKPA
eukprot:2427219-Pleurochrysis_carterae.AAC.2